MRKLWFVFASKSVSFFTCCCFLYFHSQRYCVTCFWWPFSLLLFFSVLGILGLLLHKDFEKHFKWNKFVWHLTQILEVVIICEIFREKLKMHSFSIQFAFVCNVVCLLIFFRFVLWFWCCFILVLNGFFRKKFFVLSDYYFCPFVTFLCCFRFFWMLSSVFRCWLCV